MKRIFSGLVIIIIIGSITTTACDCGNKNFNEITQPPVLVSPIDGSQLNSLDVTFEWTIPSGATASRLEVDGVVVADNLTTNTTTVTLTEKAEPYVWRVIVFNSIQSYPSHDPAEWEFTIALAPQTPSLTSPADDVTICEGNQTFEWASVANADSYTLQVFTGSTATGTPAIEESVTTTSFTTTTPLAVGSYVWRVIAVDGGNESQPSPTRSLTVIAVFPAPTLTPSADYCDAMSGSFTWSEVVDASYVLEYALTSASYPGTSVTVPAGTFSHTPGTAPTAGAYKWRVKAVIGECESDWSADDTFNVTAGPPPAIPSSIDCTGPDQFNWSDTGSSYVVQFTTSAGSYPGTEVAIPAGTTSYTPTLPSLTGGTYKWRVKSVSGGCESGWSSDTTLRVINRWDFVYGSAAGENMGGILGDNTGAKMDSNGDLVIGGHWGNSTPSSIDFGGGLVSQVGTTDMFIMKYDAEGNYIWAKSIGYAGTTMQFRSLDVDSSGNIFACGVFTGSVNFGGGLRTSSGGSTDFFIASFTSAGVYRWDITNGNTNTDSAVSLSVDSNGNVVVIGAHQTDSLDLGGGVLPGNTANSFVWLAKFDNSGSHIWSKAFGRDATSPVAFLTRTDPDGNILIATYTNCKQSTNEGINYGGADLKPYCPALPSLPAWGQILAKYDPDGNHIWSATYGDGFGAIFRTMNMAVDTDGSFYFSVYGSGTLDYGWGPITITGASDSILVKMTPDGSLDWHYVATSGTGDLIQGIGLDCDGSVYITGRYPADQTLTFPTSVTDSTTALSLAGVGGGTLADMYLAKLTGSGTFIWGEAFGSNNSDTGLVVLVGEDDNLYNFGIVNISGGSIDFGNGTIATLSGTGGSNDLFIRNRSKY